ncbi:ABC transporter permease family protein [Elstera litoralis]|uniref:ABC transporter permease n=1 Tax=Elstera litoralis TaxID=552518 RepID=UPI001E5A4E72|nr:ABC transporter permease [Elstera litoralis]
MGRIIRVLGARLLQAALVAGVVGTLCFALAEALPGDQAYRIAAGRYGIDLVSTEAANTVRAELGLDRPWWQRLGGWYGDIATGNFGVSLVSTEPVVDELRHQLGSTVRLSILALGLSVLIGLPLGAVMAVRAGRDADIAGLIWATALRAVPSFCPWRTADAGLRHLAAAAPRRRGRGAGKLGLARAHAGAGGWPPSPAE